MLPPRLAPRRIDRWRYSKVRSFQDERNIGGQETPQTISQKAGLSQRSGQGENTGQTGACKKQLRQSLMRSETRPAEQAAPIKAKAPPVRRGRFPTSNSCPWSNSSI